MDGRGTYLFESGAVYEGFFKDGQFHGHGCITFPHGGCYNGLWRRGALQRGMYRSDDKLPFDPNDDSLSGWRFLNPVWDRRFYQEVQHGLSDAANTIKTRACNESGHPIHHIPTGCYDAGNGFYHPPTQTIYHYLDIRKSKQEANKEENWKFLSHVEEDEGRWLAMFCRKGDDVNVGHKLQASSVADPDQMARVANTAQQKLGSFAKYSRKLDDIGKHQDQEKLKQSIKQEEEQRKAIEKFSQLTAQ